MDNQTLQCAADRYGTPSYMFDLDQFTARIDSVKALLGERVRICYAMKANPFLTQAAAFAADGLEVCSPGEYAICRRAGIPAEKIVLSGVNKERADLEAVILEQGAHTYTAESLNQLKLLEECAAKAGEALAARLGGRGVTTEAGSYHSLMRVLLRVTSGNQFGMDEDTIFSIFRHRKEYPHLDLRGLQYYSGTQKRKLEKIDQELGYLDSLCTRLQEETGAEVCELEYGPGFPVAYFEGEAEPEEELLLKNFKKVLDSLTFHGIIFLEMGRFLAAPCGSYLTRIADTKTNQGQNYCIIDGGINHINYYGQAMAMKLPIHRFLPVNRGEADENQLLKWTVCGSLCTSGDVLVKNLPLPGVKIGDLLVFDRIGAYSVTEGIYLFLSRKLPGILTYTRTEGIKLVRAAYATDCLNDGSC